MPASQEFTCSQTASAPQPRGKTLTRPRSTKQCRSQILSNNWKYKYVYVCVLKLPIASHWQATTQKLASGCFQRCFCIGWTSESRLSYCLSGQTRRLRSACIVLLSDQITAQRVGILEVVGFKIWRIRVYRPVSCSQPSFWQDGKTAPQPQWSRPGASDQSVKVAT